MNEWDQFELGASKRKAAQSALFDDPRPAKKEKRDKGESKEDLFAFQCRANKLPPYVRQAQFALSIKRRWSFDFAFHVMPGKLSPREIKVAVEIEGMVMRKVNGEWQMGGRHATITGFKEDCVKYATAALLGWTVLRFEQSQVKKGFAIGMT